MIWDFSESIVGIGDTHFPFDHRESIEASLDLIEASRPKHVVQMGDLYDCFSQTKFPRRVSITPRDEKKLGRESAEWFWDEVKKRSPKSKRWQLLGNHDSRPMKRLMELAPDLDPFLQFEDHWSFKGVETIFDPRQCLEIGKILFTHGHRKFGEHMVEADFRNIVCGHTHLGGVIYRRISDERIAWELNVGYLGDPFHEALIYRPMAKFFKWTHGVGVIDQLGPRFVAF